MHRIEIYTTTHCGHCRRAKALFEEMDLDFREFAVDRDDDRRREMVERCGRRSVPQIFIGGRHVGGAEELFELDRRGRLAEILREAK